MANRFSVEAVFKAVDRITRPVKQMQSSVGRFTRSAERQFKKLNRVINSVGKSLFSIGKRVAAFGLGAAGAGLAAFTLALNRTADAADNLAKTARRLEFPIEEMQEWRFVAEQSGVPVALLESSLGAFSKRLGEARAGTGSLNSMLAKTNPQFLEQLKATTDTSKAFELYLDFIRQAETATDRAALASAGFSRAGLKLINITDNSAAAVKALRLEQRQNGVITQQQAEAAEAYNDALNSLKKAGVGLLQDVLLPMLPTITSTVRGWRELIIANRELIQTRAVEFLQRVGMTMRDLFEQARRANLLDKLLAGLDAVVRFIKFIQQNGATIMSWVKWVVGLTLAFKALSIILGVVNLLMLANPITLIVAGIIAATAAVVAFVANVEKIDDWLDGLPGLAKAALAPFRALVKLIRFAKENAGVIASAAGGAFDSAADFLGFGGEDSAAPVATTPTTVSPEAVTASRLERSESMTRTEVTLKDETGRAEVTGGKTPTGFKLQQTGAF